MDPEGRSKKQKNYSKAPASKDSNGKKFSKLCNIGLVSGSVPASLEKRGTQFFITVPTGRSFQIYDVESLQLLFTSHPETEGEITSVLAGPDDCTFVAAARAIQVFQRGGWQRKLKTRNEHIIGMICLGEWVLGLSPRRLHFFNAKTSINCEYSIDFEEGKAAPTVIFHPNTYLNKILIGFADGCLQLWNVKTKVLLHTFEPFPAIITMIAQSPVNDIVAVGLANGDVWLLDVLQSKRLFSLSTGGPFTSLSFRHDPEHPHLAVAMSSGEILIWDLNSRLLKERIMAHSGKIGSVHFITGHPMMVSYGEDNSIKVWVAEPTFRLLKHRSGHRGPASQVYFYGDAGKSLLSAGLDGSLHYTSLIKASQSFQFAYGTPESKLKKFVNETRSKPITDVSFFITKDLKWDNIVTVHDGSTAALSWRGDLKVMGNNVLHPPEGQEERLTKSAISPCGNFAILGGQEGGIYVFNLQSGLLKKSIKASIKSMVVGLLVKSDNETLLVAYSSGLIELRDFKTLRIVSEERLEDRILTSSNHQTMNIIVLGLKSGTIVAFDLELSKIVRIFKSDSSITNSITDLAISKDCKHLVAAFGSSGIWIWDFITGNVVDVIKTEDRPLSIDISASSELLAVSHEKSLGMSLWVNNFEAIQNPSVSAYLLGEKALVDGKLNYLSEVNLSKLLNLLNIDTIKSASKPFEQTKRKALPFFLDAQFGKSLVDEPAKEESKPQSSVAFIDTKNGLVARLLDWQDGKTDGQTICHWLLAQSIGSIDFELKTLVNESSEDHSAILNLFLRFLIEGIESGCNFDAYQSFMNVILKLHYPFLRSSLKSDSEVSESSDTGRLLRQLFQTHTAAWRKIERLFQQSLCLEAFCKNDF